MACAATALEGWALRWRTVRASVLVLIRFAARGGAQISTVRLDRPGIATGELASEGLNQAAVGQVQLGPGCLQRQAGGQRVPSRVRSDRRRQELA